MNPIIFQTGIFTLYTLWIFIAIAMLVTTYNISRLSIKKGLKLQFLSENSLMIFLSGLAGARLLGVLTNIHIYFDQFNVQTFLNLFAIWDKGLSIWGAMIGSLAYLYHICKTKEEQDFFKWMDVIVPSVILGLAITHIGAFFAGSNYGHETSLPWGVNFENPAIKYAVPIHPTQIYAFIYAAAIYTASQLIHVEKNGVIGLGTISAYSLFRFLEEFVRGDDAWIILGIRLPQVFAFIAFVGSAVFLYKYYKK